MKKHTLAAANSIAENHLQTSSRPALLDQQGISIDIPEEGSLGLLALGYVGLMLWRNKKRTQRQPNPTLAMYASSLNPSQDEN